MIGQPVVRVSHGNGSEKFFPVFDPVAAVRPVKTVGRFYEERVGAELEEKAERTELLEAVVRRIADDLVALSAKGMLTVEENAWRADIDRALGEAAAS